MNASLPIEIAEFENLLRKPNSDPTGFAGFFNSGEIWVARVPARLDVMGGIADYSGANVCEAVLGRGMLMALQARTDRHAAHPLCAGRRAQPAGGDAHPAGLFFVRRRGRQLRARSASCATRTQFRPGRPTSAGAFSLC